MPPTSAVYVVEVNTHAERHFRFIRVSPLLTALRLHRLLAFGEVPTLSSSYKLERQHQFAAFSL